MPRPDLDPTNINLPAGWELPSAVNTYIPKDTPVLASLAELGIGQMYACGVDLNTINPDSLYGLIGGREISEAEYMMAHQVGFTMKQLGYIGIGGFAEGADTAGVVGAIAAAELPEPTVLGVLSGPINSLYMPERKEYSSDSDYQLAISARKFRARTVTKLAGALLTQYPVTAGNPQWNHLARNRITARLAINPDKRRHLVSVGGNSERGGTLNTVNTTLNFGGRVLLLAAPDQIYRPTDLVGYYRQNPNKRVLIANSVQEAVDILTGGKEA